MPDLVAAAFGLLSEAELREIAERAEEWCANSSHPWSVVYEVIGLSAHSALAERLGDDSPE